MDIETDYDHVTQHKLTQLAGCACHTGQKTANTKYTQLYKNVLTWWNASPVIRTTVHQFLLGATVGRVQKRHLITENHLAALKMVLFVSKTEMGQSQFT